MRKIEYPDDIFEKIIEYARKQDYTKLRTLLMMYHKKPVPEIIDARVKSRKGKLVVEIMFSRSW